MIRPAKISDADALLELWEEGYKDTPFSEMEYDRGYVQRMFANVCTFDEQFFCRVVDIDGQLHGVLIGYIDRNFWGVPIAQTLVSYANRESDKLVRQFTSWAKDKGAKMVTVMTVPGKDRYGKMITRMGFEPSGGLHTKRI